MRNCIMGLALLLSVGLSHAAATLPGPAFPNYADPAALEAACQRGLVVARAAVKKLERRKVDAGWLGAYDDLNALGEDLAGPVFVLSNVHPQKPMRDAAEACELKWQDFLSTLGQNETLYRAARRARSHDAIDRELLKLALEGFEDAGVSLPPGKRNRAKTIQDRITELTQTFDKNVRDASTKVPLSQAQLAGVPESVWKQAKRDDEGRFLLGTDEPTYQAVLQTAVDAQARERMWRAKLGEGGEANLKLLGEIGQLRREYAQLFGFASYADFTLRRRMAANTANAKAFLDEVRAAVIGRERRELDELRAAKARELGRPVDEVKLDRWDVSYYSERVKRERYSVDQEAFRPYFPPQESMRFVMRLIEKTMGVRYTQVAGVALWHADVQAWQVSDARSGRPLASLLVDLYPRDGKYNHAAVWSYRNGATRGGRAPQAALVVNLDRNGLTLDDLQTLLHEFGHAVHNGLSRTRYSSQGGTSTLRDFVEAPSQMLEEWIFDPRVLALMQEVCPTCKPVPEDLVSKARVAERYGKGVRYARQHLYATYDLALTDTDAPEPMALWARMEGATLLGHVPGSMLPASFSHLAGGYAAGYYGYLWSEVVAADLRTAFGDNKLDAKVGRRYRDIVLANGGQKPPQELVREFLGREGNSKAFFEELQR